MENMKQVIQKVIASLIIFAMIMVQYAIVGFTAITYAIDMLSTQSENVQFKAYFVENDKETATIERSIENKDLKLNIDVSVKNEGYFNGTISLENAGFRIKDESIINNNVKEIKNNVIYLNQINAEDTAHIEVGIEFLNENEISTVSLNSETDVKLKGTYISSKKNNEIDATSKVLVNWNIPQNTKAEILSKILTNKIYTINQQNKRIVQFLVSSKLTNNSYPTKNTKLLISIPEGATNIEVHKRTTKATNGEKEFTQNNYKIENNTLEINVDNSETDGKISWIKGVQDVFVVTYEFDENKDLSNTNITVNGTITTFDKDVTTGIDIAFNGEQSQVDLSKEKDGIISVSQEEKETSIYKGKIYSGENRDITSDTIVYVDYASAANEFTLTENAPVFTYEETDDEDNKKTITKESNTEYKSLKVNKVQLSAVLGETWSLKIEDKTITNETQSEENGDIVIELSKGLKTVDIKASKPIKNGAFLIESTKTLLKTEYTRDEIKQFTNLEDSSSVQYTKYDNSIHKYTHSFIMNLKETESKADFKCEQQALMTNQEGQELHLTVVLESKNESQDLYKNPTLKIILPKQIKNVTKTQAKLLNSNGLEIKEEDFYVSEEDGQKVINIKLTGEQISYIGEAIQGTTILINAPVELDKEAESSEEEIKLNYTNENASKYTDQGTEKVNIQIIANQNQDQNQGQDQSQNQNQGQDQNQGQNQDQNQGQNQNQNNENQDNSNDNVQNLSSDIKMELTAKVGGETINQGDTVREGEKIVYTLKVTNTGSTEKNNINIETTIPENTTLIERNPKYPFERFYSDEELDGEIRKDYFIEKTDRNTSNSINIKAGESVILKYIVETNKNITQNTNIEFTTKVKEGNEEGILKLQNTLSKSNLKIDLVPITRTGEETIKVGYGYLYRVNIKNISDEEQRNIKVSVNRNDLIDIVNIKYAINGDLNLVKNKDSIITIDSIAPNSTAYMEISVSIKQNIEQLKTADMYIKVEDNSGVNYRSNLLSEPVGGVKIEATLTQKSGNNTSEKVKNGDKITYEIQLKNIGDEDAKELSIVDRISRYVDIESVLLNGEKCEYIEGNEEDDKNGVYKIATINSSLKVGKEMTITINCIVKNDIKEKGTLSILNKAIISEKVKIAETEQKVFYIENIPTENNQSEDSSDEEKNSDRNYEENSEQNNNTTNRYTISGIVWNDTNKNGSRDRDEELFQGIRVYAINTTNNSIVKNEDGNEIISTTNTNGEYSLSNISKGQYIVVFEYNTEKYILTEYKKDGVSENNNSDAIKASRIINGEEREVAITDSLNIESNCPNIDLGLIDSNNEKLQIKKTISKITVTNNEGTKKYNFDNTELAKVEISSKSLSGSNVVIEYNITIKNTGSTNMYAKNIVDYLPSSLTFTSTMNKDWYKKNNNLYNSSLSQTPIKSGETKEIKLVLTKKMTATNTGLINNKAKIESIYNTNGTQISNDENSSADVIISVKTGETIIYALFALIIIVISLEIAYIVRKILIKIERR